MKNRMLPEIVTSTDRERLEAWEERTGQKSAGYGETLFILSGRFVYGWSKSVKLIYNRKIRIFLGLI